MASSDDTVILEGVPRIARMKQRVKTGKAPKSAATISGIRTKKKHKPLPLPTGVVRDEWIVNKGRIDKKQTGRSVVEESRKAIAKKQTGRSVVEESGKDAVAVDKKQTEWSAIDEMFDGVEFINLDDIPNSEMDEEVLKQVAEMQQDITQVWRDWVDTARREGIEFGGPSDLVPC